jgi:hypothetical protein
MQAVKLELEIDKLKAEIVKIRRDTGVVPFLAGATVMIAATGLATLILKLLGMGA